MTKSNVKRSSCNYLCGKGACNAVLQFFVKIVGASHDSSRQSNIIFRHSIKVRLEEFRLGHEAVKSIGMVPWTGVEPVTLRLGGGCSIQLSYQGMAAILTE